MSPVVIQECIAALAVLSRACRRQPIASCFYLARTQRRLLAIPPEFQSVFNSATPVSPSQHPACVRAAGAHSLSRKTCAVFLCIPASTQIHAPPPRLQRLRLAAWAPAVGGRYERHGAAPRAFIGRLFVARTGFPYLTHCPSHIQSVDANILPAAFPEHPRVLWRVDREARRGALDVLWAESGGAGKRNVGRRYNERHGDDMSNNGYCAASSTSRGTAARAS
ncbi:hypothetical protein C8R44DRAFT_745999 [Mycena epipterygia]|nr:hypothetical protein C8R44DRAFT_745999 [Mycena epipterygia]